MQKLLSISVSMLLSLTAFGQIQIKEINESLVKINGDLYASKYEVSNKVYTSFLNSLKQSKLSNLVAIAEIDSLNWMNKLSYNEPYVHYYHTHVGYHNFPVVNISYEGATLFCKWLTENYNSNPKRKFKKVLFRLPTEKEWIMAAQAGDSTAMYAWAGNSLRNAKGQVMYNFKRAIKDTLWVDNKYIENADVTAPIKSYWSNSFGLYNMSGNVAEMINEKGIVKGGSWKDDSEYLKVNTSYKYEGNTQPSVGFRYFAEVIEK